MELKRTAEEKPIVKSAENPAAPIAVTGGLSSDNHVYFNQSVTSDNLLSMMRQIREIDNTLRHTRLSHSVPDNFPMTPIWLHVQSYGGDIMAAFGAADQIEHILSPVYSVVEGYACSAATLISMACTKRLITRRSYMLIHQLFSLFWGTYEQFKDEAALQSMLMDQLVIFYAKHSNLKRKDIKKMLKHDTWMNAQQALDYGLVDELK